MSAETRLGAIDASKCAFVTWVDLDGMSHMVSEAGYSQAQVAGILRQLADVCDRKAREEGATSEPTS